MSDYDDQISNGQAEPTASPEMIPEPKAPRFAMAREGEGHEVEGVACTAEAARMHKQAVAIIDSETREEERAAAEEKAKQAAEAAATLMKMAAEGGEWNLVKVRAMLREFAANDFPSDNDASMVEPLGGLFSGCLMTMHEIARVTGRKFDAHSMPLLSSLPREKQ